MTFQWCLPQTQGRGAGLGNELVPWARAFLMAQVLRARWLHPAFGLNGRGYRRHFGTPAWDWLVHRAMAAGLPHVRFDEADHLAHGGGDVTESFARFAQARGLAERGPLVVLTSGMWGGIHHIARAREFVRGALYGARHAAHNLAELSSRLHPDKLTVAMHVRLGDFEAASPGLQTYRGRFNCALPLEWFMQIGHQLRDHWGDAIQFQVFSDGDPQALAPLLQLLKPVNTRCAHPADVSDLLALSRADLLVCSVSSYSIWAAALSRRALPVVSSSDARSWRWLAFHMGPMNPDNRRLAVPRCRLWQTLASPLREASRWVWVPPCRRPWCPRSRGDGPPSDAPRTWFDTAW